MASGAMTGLGTILAINADGGGFDDVGEVFDLTPPNETSPSIDVTHYGSEGAESIGGLPDFGELTFVMNFIPGSASEAMILGIPRGTNVPIRITWPNAKTWIFEGNRTGYEPAAPLDDRMTCTVTFKVSGSVARGG